MTSKLQDQINKNKDNLDSIRCGGCGNSLIHCGKYIIIDAIEKEDPEGILCETCQQQGRKLKGTVKKVAPKEDIKEKFKKIKEPETIETSLTSKFDIKKPEINKKKEENVEKEKEKKVVK